MVFPRGLPLLAALFAVAAAFVEPPPRFTVAPARVTRSLAQRRPAPPPRPFTNRFVVARAAEEGADEKPVSSVEEAVAAAEQMKSADSLYESDSDAVIKQRAESQISNSMKNKLKAELRAQGADSNSAFNPYPVIFLVIAGLVVTAGAGIFF
eukprot:CAMPEP_0172587154 /NCGR_PEP_ID=MMETSP1068-20121228/6262_1 /TAXON_ID=35684 /ORGANISM="Pseudopedinella elastica, Strain CCMP716" /LENGTH=151 /DNA_ID=CAMNT_0013382085 /DNA_START=42 /DNA_END=497 /DNA_ORIENTATION=+